MCRTPSSHIDNWLNCIAHEDAVQKCSLMHSDISAGNILINPTVVHDVKTRRLVIDWHGILSDWELAKHTDVKITLQPERTVRLLSTLRVCLA